MDNQPLPEKWIRDVETIKILADPLRLQIVRLLQEPKTIKQIASVLKISATKLYYHVNLLQKHQLICVVGHNLETGIVEKIYQVTARDFKLVNPLLSEDIPAEAVGALFSDMLYDASLGLQQALLARNEEVRAPPRHPFVSQKRFRLTDAQLSALHARLVDLIQDVTALNTENAALEEPEYELTVVFYRK